MGAVFIVFAFLLQNVSPAITAQNYNKKMAVVRGLQGMLADSIWARKEFLSGIRAASQHVAVAGCRRAVDFPLGLPTFALDQTSTGLGWMHCAKSVSITKDDER